MIWMLYKFFVYYFFKVGLYEFTKNNAFVLEWEGNLLSVFIFLNVILAAFAFSQLNLQTMELI